MLGTMVHAAKPIRIACVGDSITEGAGLPHPATDAWPAVLQKLLGPEVIVENFGRGGATACVAGDTPYAESPQARAAFACESDVVIIMLGTNDARSANATRHQNFALDITNLGRRFANLPFAPLIVLCTPLPAFKPAHSVDPSVIENELAPAVRSVAQIEGWPLIDIFHLLGDLGPTCEDGIHPDAAGTARIATTIATAFTKQNIRFNGQAPNRRGTDLQEKNHTTSSPTAPA